MWFHALTQHFTSAETFAGARRDTILAAQELGYDAAAVASAWSRVGVN